MKRTILFLSAVTMFVLAFLSYRYLASVMLYFGLSHFYAIAPGIPEQCFDVVADAGAGFSVIYQYVGWIVSVALSAVGIALLYFFWRAWSSSHSFR